jgi:multidrug resistance efflux pump
LTRQGLDTVTSRLEANFRKDLGTGREVDPVEVRRRVESDPQYLTALGAVEQAEAAVQEKEYALQQAQKAPYEEQVRQADAAVKLAEADLAKAKLVAAETVVRAKVAGIVERLEAAPGLVVGPTTRTPLLWLVPNGPRVVRAEVVPEFAFRIQERLGQPVTIMDDNNPTLTYPGEVKHVGGSFLPKRSGGGEFVVGRPQAVLEVIVTVTDPAPPGKPPLRVGQPVRVSIGQ